MRFEDFPWAEFLRVRKRMIHWLRLYGDEGEPLDFDRIAKMVSCDPMQARLIYMSAIDKGRRGDIVIAVYPDGREVRCRREFLERHSGYEWDEATEIGDEHDRYIATSFKGYQ